MKRNYTKLFAFILVMVLILSFALPVNAAATATVNVRVEVFQQSSNSPYANVAITLGQNTKNTNRRGFAEFKLANIPTETMVQLAVIDPNKPNGSHAKLNLKLDTVTSEVVHSMGPAQYDIYIAYTQNTDTIVIRYMVTTNDEYELMSTEFEQSGGSSNQQPPADQPPEPPPENNPGEPQPEHYDDPPPEEHFESEPGEPGFDPDMQHEPYDNYRGGVPYLWLYIVIGVLGVGVITLVIVLAVKSSRKRKQINVDKDQQE